MNYIIKNTLTTAVIAVSALAAALSVTSCSDELDNVKPRNAILLEELSDEDQGKLLTGLYATMESYVKHNNKRWQKWP